MSVLGGWQDSRRLRVSPPSPGAGGGEVRPVPDRHLFYPQQQGRQAQTQSSDTSEVMYLSRKNVIMLSFKLNLIFEDHSSESDRQ